MIGLIGLLLAAAPAHDPRCDSIKTDDLVACAQADFQRADAALNAQYRSALATIKGWQSSGADDAAANGGISYGQSLLVAQRAWLAYRDAECRFQIYGNAGGHELPIYRFGCLAELTRQRTKQLQADFTEGH